MILSFIDKKCPSGHEFKTTDNEVNFCPICDPEKFHIWMNGSEKTNYYTPHENFSVTSRNSDGYEKASPLLRQNDHLPSRNAPSR
jgi:hypothetical protein